MEVLYAIKFVTDDNLRKTIKERIPIETLVAMLMSIDADFGSDYAENVNVLQAMGEHYYDHKKLDLDSKTDHERWKWYLHLNLSLMMT